MTFPIMQGCLQIFNVDHGACALLSMPGDRKMLVDCGHSTDRGDGKPWYPGEHLAALGVTFLETLVCTNYDEDHASGFNSLDKNGVGIGCILGNPSVPPEVITHLKTKDGMGPGIAGIAASLADRRARGWDQTPLLIPNVHRQWFWNPYGTRWDTENNLSLVLHLSVYGTNFLFMGDLERDGCENLLKVPSFAALMPAVHVLVAAHHGRENGKCPDMFDAHGCNPQLVVISDCAKKYQSQETVPYYYDKAKGVSNVRGVGNWRYVMTTRNDDEIIFRWENGRCLVY
jgi:beta-lactamase superfamily II metal-dependent hydrolase